MNFDDLTSNIDDLAIYVESYISSRTLKLLSYLKLNIFYLELSYFLTDFWYQLLLKHMSAMYFATMDFYKYALTDTFRVL